MKKNNIITISIIVTFIIILLVLVVVRLNYNPEQQNINETKVYQCNDGIDNDGDGLIDFLDGNGDPNCSSETDNFERELPKWLIWVVLLGLVVIVGFLIFRYYKGIKEPKDEDEIRIEPVGPLRAFEIILSNFSKEIFRGEIEFNQIIESDGYILEKPANPDDIKHTAREYHVVPSTGNKFQIDFFNVYRSEYAGAYQTVNCVSKGEKHLKEGIYKYRKSGNINTFRRQSRTFNLDSPVSEKTRLELLRLDAVQNSDAESKDEVEALLKSLSSNNSSSDEDDYEFKERLQVQQQNKYKKKNLVSKKNTSNTGSQQSFNPEAQNIGGNDDEEN